MLIIFWEKRQFFELMTKKKVVRIFA